MVVLGVIRSSELDGLDPVKDDPAAQEKFAELERR